MTRAHPFPLPHLEIPHHFTSNTHSPLPNTHRLLLHSLLQNPQRISFTYLSLSLSLSQTQKPLRLYLTPWNRRTTSPSLSSAHYGNYIYIRITCRRFFPFSLSLFLPPQKSPRNRDARAWKTIRNEKKRAAQLRYTTCTYLLLLRPNSGRSQAARSGGETGGARRSRGGIYNAQERARARERECVYIRIFTYYTLHGGGGALSPSRGSRHVAATGPRSVTSRQPSHAHRALSIPLSLSC